MIYLKSSLWMLVGAFMMMFIIIAMNEDAGQQNKPEKKKRQQFEVTKMQKPKTAPKPKPKPKPRKRTASKPAPLPALGTALAGVDLGIPEFAVGDFDMSDTALLKDVGDNLVMTESTVDEAPKPKARTPIEYPKAARKAGIRGYVLFNLLIDQSGNVAKVKMLESQPEGVFDEVALASVQTWKFAPATYQGNPVRVWAKQKIRFDFQ